MRSKRPKRRRRRPKNNDPEGEHFIRKEGIVMPGFDGTGPMGMGPMTGGGRGFCTMPMGAYGPSGYGMGQFPYSMPYDPYYGSTYTPPVFVELTP